MSSHSHTVENEMSFVFLSDAYFTPYLRKMRNGKYEAASFYCILGGLKQLERQATTWNMINKSLSRPLHFQSYLFPFSKYRTHYFFSFCNISHYHIVHLS